MELAKHMSMHILSHVSVCLTPFLCTCGMAIPAQVAHSLTPVRCRAGLYKKAQPWV